MLLLYRVLVLASQQRHFGCRYLNNIELFAVNKWNGIGGRYACQGLVVQKGITGPINIKATRKTS